MASCLEKGQTQGYFRKKELHLLKAPQVPAVSCWAFEGGHLGTAPAARLTVLPAVVSSPGVCHARRASPYTCHVPGSTQNVPRNPTSGDLRVRRQRHWQSRLPPLHHPRVLCGEGHPTDRLSCAPDSQEPSLRGFLLICAEKGSSQMSTCPRQMAPFSGLESKPCSYHPGTP